jgi:hypothetical protein
VRTVTSFDFTTVLAFPPEYELVLNRLPSFHWIGGNRRFTNPRAEAKAFAEDRRHWIETMIVAEQRMARFDDQPTLYGTVGYTVTLYSPTLNRTDEDNAQAALKTLLDLLEIPRPIKNGSVRGYLGLIENDRQLRRLLPIMWERSHIQKTRLQFWEIPDDTS